jgi:hypothetical protein
MQPVSESQNYKNITSTTIIFTGPCGLLGIWVSSASNTPTLKVQDGSATVANTFTPVAPNFYVLPFKCATSLVVIISGTVDCTVAWMQP